MAVHISIKMKIINSIIGLISGLIALDIILSFFGLSPFNEGVGLFLYSDVWYLEFIVSVVVFGFSVSRIFFSNQPNVARPKSNVLLMASGICLVLGALPAGFMTEISVNWDGSSAYGGIGYVLSGVMIASGIAAIIISTKRKTKITY